MGLLGCQDPHVHPRFSGHGHRAPQRGGTFRFAFDTDVRTVDPALASDVVAAIPTKLVFASLVDYAGGSTELVPALAERWDVSPDGLRYTFHLRPNLRFSTGRRITSEDFRYSWERMLNPRRIPSPGAENYRLIVGYDAFREGHTPHLQGVETPDPDTVVVRLAAPDRTFLHVMAMRFASVVPREVVERLGDEAFGLAPVGAGPFALERWEQGSRIILRRNLHYWDAPRPWLDRIVFELSVARHLQFMRFLAGEIEYAHNFSLATADYLWIQRTPAWRPHLLRSPGATIGGLMMNTTMRPFDNLHVRRAVAFALDRDAICRARNNRIRPAWALYPPGIAGYRESPPGAQRYDVAEARREMQLAGFPEGYPEEIDLWISEGEAGLVYGQLFQADLQRIGLRTRIRQAALSVYYSSLGRPDTIPMAFDGWSMDYPDPNNFIEPNFHSRGIQPENASNHAFYRSSELDALLDRAKTEGDRARRVALYQQAEDVLLRDAPWAYLYTTLELNVVQPYVRNFVPHPVWNYYVGDVWMDLPLRRWTQTQNSRARALGPAYALANPFTAGARP
ncbi:MAG: ABC transporter substrate-binding protein [Deltaproteobacteria bacterium]|nr:ABC transporter substrate-binding protein [Deltaproteobacteria bacterium]